MKSENSLQLEWSGMRKTFHFTSIHYMAVVNKMLPVKPQLYLVHNLHFKSLLL